MGLDIRVHMGRRYIHMYIRVHIVDIKIVINSYIKHGYLFEGRYLNIVDTWV